MFPWQSLHSANYVISYSKMAVFVMRISFTLLWNEGFGSYTYYRLKYQRRRLFF